LELDGYISSWICRFTGIIIIIIIK
jgi:hypothetical protein